MTTKSDNSTEDQSLNKGSFRDSINRRFKNFRASSFTNYNSRPSSRDIGNKLASKSSENLSNKDTDNSNYNSKMTSGLADLDLPPLAPLTLSGYKSTTKNRLLTNELAEDIRNLIASRLQLYSEWRLLYSLEQHGASLNTLYTRCSPEFEKPSNNLYSLNQSYSYSTSYNTYSSNHQKKLGYILIVKDSKGNKFGAYTNEYFHPSDNKRFYGNGECFLWKCKHNNCFTINKSKDSNKILRSFSRNSALENEAEGEVATELSNGLSNRAIAEEQYNPLNSNNAQNGNIDEHKSSSPESQSEGQQSQPYEQHLQFFAYPYTGLNDFIIYCTKNFLSLGVGDGHYGLWIDNDLISGVSYKCLTFGNEPLSDSGVKFKINNVEVWKVGG